MLTALAQAVRGLPGAWLLGFGEDDLEAAYRAYHAKACRKVDRFTALMHVASLLALLAYWARQGSGIGLAHLFLLLAVQLARLVPYAALQCAGFAGRGKLLAALRERLLLGSDLMAWLLLACMALPLMSMPPGLQPYLDGTTLTWALGLPLLQPLRFAPSAATSAAAALAAHLALCCAGRASLPAVLLLHSLSLLLRLLLDARMRRNFLATQAPKLHAD